MPMPRSLAGTKIRFAESKTVRLPMTMRPDCGRSSPARQRSVVVLPQPDGPSSVMSLPVSASRLMPSTARTSAPEARYDLCKFSIANIRLYYLFPPPLAGRPRAKVGTSSAEARSA